MADNWQETVGTSTNYLFILKTYPFYLWCRRHSMSNFSRNQRWRRIFCKNHHSGTFTISLRPPWQKLDLAMACSKAMSSTQSLSRIRIANSRSSSNLLPSLRWWSGKRLTSNQVWFSPVNRLIRPTLGYSRCSMPQLLELIAHHTFNRSSALAQKERTNNKKKSNNSKTTRQS